MGSLLKLIFTSRQFLQQKCKQIPDTDIFDSQTLHHFNYIFYEI